MKRSIIMMACTAMSFWAGATAMAFEIGAPEPYSKVKGFSAGIGYSSDLMRLESSDDGLKLETDQIYVQGYYSGSANTEACLRIGVADASISDTTPEFRDGRRFVLSASARWLFMLDNILGAGLFVQTGTLSDYKDGDRKIRDAYDGEAGFCLQAHPGPFILYAGPLAYWARAQYAEPGRTAHLRQKGFMGGYSGVRLTLPGGFHANAEWQYKSGGTASFSIVKTL